MASMADNWQRIAVPAPTSAKRSLRALPIEHMVDFATTELACSPTAMLASYDGGLHSTKARSVLHLSLTCACGTSLGPIDGGRCQDHRLPLED